MANENHTQSHIDGGVFEKFMEQIVKRQNISLKGKSILDISGGNGSFAKNLESQGARVVLTEYSQASVNYAREHYGVKAECFDFQSDSIQEIFHEKFDLVLLRAAVMFCEDIPRFANDLKKILHPDSQVVLEGVEPPTPAAFLRWQFDDYTYLRMYQVKSVVEFFEKSGYELLDQYEGSSRHYLDNYSKAMKLAQLIYALPVCLKNLKWNLYTHNFNLLFKPDFLP
jgi:2-polyprenyl-3-methyl-5-hydroxy-6-metoxy-1,4-benzoquinol methylase